MIKLKDLLKLDEIKYTGSIKPKHQKRMERELKHIHEVQVKHMPPPDNSSQETRSELNWLKNYNDGEVNEDVVKRGDNIKKVYEEYCKDNKLKIAFYDMGTPVDPEKVKHREIDNIKPGGLGTFFIQEIMDVVEFQDKKKKPWINHLILSKKINY